MSALKVLVVGQENVGKTTLIAHLLKGLGPKEKGGKKEVILPPETPGDKPGISISPPVVTRVGDIPHDISLQFWDFSGAEVFLSTHQFFLTERALYVVVCNVTVPLEQTRVMQWIKMIRFYAPNSSIVVVGTHLDTVKQSRRKEASGFFTEELMQSRYAKYIKGIFAVSTVKELGCRELLQGIQDQVATYDFLKNPLSKEILELEEIFSKEKEKRVAEGSVPVLQWNEVLALSDPSIKEATVLAMVKDLELLGRIMYFPGKEDKRKRLKSPLPSTLTVGLTEGFSNIYGVIILSPSWLSALFGSIVNTKHYGVSTGFIDYDILMADVWGAVESQEKRTQLEHLLAFCDLIFRFPGTNLVLVPGLLGETLPEMQQYWPTYDANTHQLERHFLFSFLPFGLFGQLMIQIMQKEYKTFVWKYGMLIESEAGIITKIALNPATSTITLITRAPAGHPEGPVITFCSILEKVNAFVEHECNVKPQIFVPCPFCYLVGQPVPTMWPMNELEGFLLANTDAVCNKDPKEDHVSLPQDIAPDLIVAASETPMVDVEKSVNDSNLQLLGEGAFAKVYKSVYNGMEVAIKILVASQKAVEEEELVAAYREFRKEVKIMTSIQHPNLVSLVAFSLAEPPCMVLELIRCGDLYKVIHTEDEAFPWELRLRCALDIARAMMFMHSLDPPLVHRDLKSPNCMIASLDPYAPACAKVADFGLTKELQTGSFRGVTAAQREVGNPTWLAPEILRGQPNGMPADVYAYGIILWEIYSRLHPYSGYLRMLDMEDAIATGKRPEIKEDEVNKAYSALIKRCWHDDPAQRPTFEAVATVFLTRIIEEMHPQLHTFLQGLVVEGRRTRMSAVKSLPTQISRRHSMKSAAECLPLVGWSIKPEQDLVDRWGKNISFRGEMNMMKLIKQVGDQILVMPKPSNATMKDLLSELMGQGGGLKFKIFNLSRFGYDYGLFNAVIAEYPLEDVINFRNLEECIKDVTKWVQIDPTHVALIHDDSAVSFTASSLVSSASLLSLGKVKSGAVALSQFYAMTGVKPVIQASHRRYLTYYVHRTELASRGVHLHKIIFNSIPSFSWTGGCEPQFSLTAKGRTIFYSKNLRGQKGDNPCVFFCRDFAVTEDVLLTFYHKDASKKMFSFLFHVGLESLNESRELVVTKSGLDIDPKNEKKFSKNFSITLVFMHQFELKSTLSVADTASSEWSLLDDASTTTISQSNNDSSFVQFKKAKVNTSLPLCRISKLNVESNDASLTISPSVMVHLHCMHCDGCGISFNTSAVCGTVVNGKVCSGCNTTVFPTCFACRKDIHDGKPYTLANKHWHASCATCTRCAKQFPIEYTSRDEYLSEDALLAAGSTRSALSNRSLSTTGLTSEELAATTTTTGARTALAARSLSTVSLNSEEGASPATTTTSTTTSTTSTMSATTLAGIIATMSTTSSTNATDGEKGATTAPEEESKVSHELGAEAPVAVLTSDGLVCTSCVASENDKKSADIQPV